MDTCTQCGTGLAAGYFCSHCGHPVDGPGDGWRTDTAERPKVVAPVEPPAPLSTPEQARFPLFADEAEAAAPEAVTDETTSETTDQTRTFAPVAAGGPAPSRHRDPQPRTWLPWLAGLVVMGLVAGLGAWLLLRGGEDPAGEPVGATPARPERSESASREPTPRETATEATSAPQVVPDDLARFAEVDAPAAAPPSRDNSGNAVRYQATNMVDGVPETTWRTPGDATGETISFTFDEPTTLTEVGLINGYAKVGQDASGPLDWYHGNRRVLAVEWLLDDGTTLTQDLDDTTVVQTVTVKQVETQAVQLRLTRVSAPGSGRAARDFTAISDVSLVGTTG